MIKEQTIMLSTGDTGYNTVTTEEINGTLESMIIDTEANVQMAISLERFPDIELFGTGVKGIEGQQFISPQKIAHTEDYEKWTFSNSKWTLNDKLIIEALGTFNVNVTVILRWSE